MSSAEITAHRKGLTDSDRAYLLDCLKKIIQIRAFEQCALEASQAIPPKVLGSIHLCAGQEAVPVAAVAGLDSADQIISTYRGHGWALASGLPVLEVLGEVCQRRIGINGGRGGSAYLMAPWTRFIGENSIVGAGVPIACGVAQANVALGNRRVVVVSIGDGAFNQGSTHEGLAFAAARDLPVIDSLREQWLVGADTDRSHLPDRSHCAACLRLRHAGNDHRWNGSGRDP